MHTDEAQWIGTYRATVGPLYAWVARRTGGERELAEDVVQESWLRALEAWAAKGLPDDPLAWLRRVAGNLLANHYRRLRPAALDPAELDLGADGREALEPKSPEAAALLSWALGRLGRAQARLVEAHHLDGVSLRALAQELGLSERAIEGRLRRARQGLRRRLAPFLRMPDQTRGQTG